VRGARAMRHADSSPTRFTTGTQSSSSMAFGFGKGKLNRKRSASHD
jgi:hypothetical protein